MANKPEIDSVTGVETTGHEWDGIKELNSPLPRWWLIIFYVSIIWAVVYMVFMPAWPGLPGAAGATPGVRGHSDRVNVADSMTELRSERSAQAQILLASDIGDIEGNPELLQFALAMGESAFGDNCATCHGAGGRGGPGYPTLADDDWIWGGSLEDIRYTINHGVRNESDDARFSQMPAYGRDGLLSGAEISDLTEYVVHLSGGQADMAAVARATPVFEMNCVTCHGADGKGDRMQGAPNLTDAVWLYGGTRDQINSQIVNGRGGVMQPWQDRLDEPTIMALSVYVHTLGGGE